MGRITPVEIAVPVAIGELHLLDQIDYHDAYAVEAPIEQSREWWMRGFLQDAPRWFQLPWAGLGKLLLGAQFGPLFKSRDHVMGWKILHDRPPEAFAIGLDSSRGLLARLATLAPAGQAIVATQVQLSTLYARALWPPIQRGHRFFAPYLLGRVASRSARDRLAAPLPETRGAGAAVSRARDRT
jgi:hypothetical protein